jgi:hypothetical protein
MWRTIAWLLTTLGLIVALWPPTLSLARLSGEQGAVSQLQGVAHWVQSAIRPQPRLAPHAVPGGSADSPFGINTFLEKEALPDVRSEAFLLLAAGGFRVARQQFVWEDIEIHGKGDFIDRRNDPAGVDAWAKYDQIVAAAEAAGITLIARLDNPPAWSRADGDAIGPHAPPDNFNDYGDFVAAVAGRYAGRVRYYQLWNEPNIYPEWGEQRPDPEAFTRLLCIGHDRIKSADPAAIIIAPALSPTIAIYGRDRDLNNLVYLQRMYQAGAGDCFDIMAVQGYGLRSGPTDQRLQPTRINVAHHLFVRDMMVQHGDSHKAVWISEAGWNAIPDGIVPPGQEPFGQVTLQQQADYAVALYERARTEWPWIGVINYWFLKEPAPEPDQPRYYFRAMEPDFTPLPVWEAVTGYANDPPTGGERAAVARYRPILFSLAAFAWVALTVRALSGRALQPEQTEQAA